MRVRDLGPLRVEAAGGEWACSGPKQSALLATPAMRANERVPLGDLVVAVTTRHGGPYQARQVVPRSPAAPTPRPDGQTIRATVDVRPTPRRPASR